MYIVQFSKKFFTAAIKTFSLRLHGFQKKSASFVYRLILDEDPLYLL